MSNELLSSKVVSRRVPPQIRAIQGGATAVFAPVGISQKGPVGVGTVITSFEEYRAIFGDDTLDSEMTHAVRAFFEELGGGGQSRVVRTVHYTDIDDPLTKTSAAATVNAQTSAGGATSGSVLGSVVGPFNLEPGDDLDIDVNVGGPATATFTATSAVRLAANAETYALVDAQTLDVEIDGGATQIITFLTAQFVAIGAATAAEVAAVINGALVGASAGVGAGPAPDITSDARGTDSSVQVTGGTANAVLGFVTTIISGTGNVADIDAVTVAEVKTIVEAAVAGLTVSNDAGRVRITSDTTGVSSSILVEAGSTADDELGLDNATHFGTAAGAIDTLQIDGKYDGTYANDLIVRISDATNGETDNFNLEVVRNGVVVEPFPNLTMDDSAIRFAETVVNASDGGSTLIEVTDLGIAGDAANKRPANGDNVPTGGDDGLVGLVDLDFIGSAAGGTGLHGLDLIDDATILAVPGRATPAVHNAMITYAEVFRVGSMFAVLDPPASTGAAGMVTYVNVTASLRNLSEFAAMYWPEVKVVNPDRVLFGNVDDIVVAPSGHIAGIMARTDASQLGGVYKQPAGTTRGILRTVLGFANSDTLDGNKRDLVYPVRINPLTTGSGLPLFIDGSRTLKEDGPFPSVGESRGVIFIDTSVKRGTTFAKHEDNDDELGRLLERTINLFLRTQMINGAFRTKNPATAFFVDAGPGLNPASVVFQNQRRIRIGLATQKPAEFIVIAITQDTRALEQELAG